MSASEVTLFSILRRYCIVKGFGFKSQHLVVLVLKVDKLDGSQVTYPDPAGFISRENGCDERDATTYKFILKDVDKL